MARFAKFDHKFDFIKGKLNFTLCNHERILFQDDEVPSIQLQPDLTHDRLYHIDHKPDKNHNSQTDKPPVDITCGTQNFFVHNVVIEYQHVDDSSAPVLNIIELERSLKKSRPQKWYSCSL